MDIPGDVVEIVDTKLEVLRYIDSVRNRGAGAIATFGGTTRDRFQGREVLELRYEAYVPMATSQLHNICTAARQRWDLIGLAVAHRIGVVPVAEESVFVAASSVHRKEALAACQYLIDEIKANVAIWKKEIYADGEQWKENVEFGKVMSSCRCENP